MQRVWSSSSQQRHTAAVHAFAISSAHCIYAKSDSQSKAWAGYREDEMQCLIYNEVSLNTKLKKGKGEEKSACMFKAVFMY